MNTIFFHLNISGDEMHRYYSGTATTVQAVAMDGRTVNFSASHLRRFVTLSGVKGLFKMVFDNQQRMVSFDRVQ